MAIVLRLYPLDRVRRWEGITSAVRRPGDIDALRCGVMYLATTNQRLQQTRPVWRGVATQQTPGKGRVHWRADLIRP